MAETVYLTAEERLASISDLLIQSIIKNNEVSLKNRQFLFGQVSTKVFKNENYIIYGVLYNFKDRGITPDEDFMKMYLTRNTKFIKDSQEYIDVESFKDLDENPLNGYVIATVNQFVRLLQLETLPNDEFKLNVEKYKQEFSNYEMNKTFSQAKLILYDGLQIGSKLYQGYADSVAYTKNKIADIEAVLDHTTGAGFINSSLDAIEDDDSVKPELIGDFGLVKELNERLGGYYTSLFYNIMAPTKGGKSKWCARAVHNICVEHGNNVSIWAHEGGHKAWWAQMRAIHFEYMYIRDKDENQRVAPLSQKEILYSNYPSEDIRALEEASRLDLFTNPSYGVMNMIDRPFKVETFIDEIETSVQLNDSKAVIIDYLQLIGWESKSLSKPQAISRAYQELLAYAKKRNIMVISPSQFTQEFMREMAKSKDGQQHEVRAAGGESSEIIRTPDINIALYASTEDLIRKSMVIMSVPSRLAEPFPDIPIYADLCSCVFSSIE